MPSNHLILCRPLLLPPSIFPSIRVFSNESALRIRWPKYWSFSFNISPSDEPSGLISFKMDWLDVSAFQGTLKSLLQHHSSKASILLRNSSTGIPSPPLAFFIVMLPKNHLTPHSRMSGSRWVITPSWLSESWRSFMYSFSVYSCHLFLISSASVRFSLAIYFIYNSVHVLVPASQVILPVDSSLRVHAFVFYICVSISALQIG